jgi:hypothetical protein
MKKKELLYEIKKAFKIKKLWLLRFYVISLNYLVEIILALYVGLSIYNFFTSKSVLGNLVLGITGLYLVWTCLAILFISQLVTMFINIHDNIEDVRNKMVNPDFQVNLNDEKDLEESFRWKSLATIIAIVLAIIFSIVNLKVKKDPISITKNNSTKNEFIEKYDRIKKSGSSDYQLRELIKDYTSVDNWTGILHKKKTDHNYMGGLMGNNNIEIESSVNKLHLSIENSFANNSMIQDIGDNEVVIFDGKLNQSINRILGLSINLYSISRFHE